MSEGQLTEDDREAVESEVRQTWDAMAASGERNASELD